MNIARPVLVVEDNQVLREALAALLRDEGYFVATAANGVEALETMRAGILPGLVLLDLMMPVLDGVGFRVRQEADPALAGVPVIAMSASGLLDEVARRTKFHEVLRKPLNVVLLLAVIRIHYCGSLTSHPCLE